MGHDVSIKVGADNSALNTGLAQAKHAVDGFKEHAEESFAELGHEFLEAFAAAAVIEGIHELFEEFGHIQDASEKLGIGAESLQKMAEVAKLSGVEMEGLVKTLQKGSKNAIDAVAGNEELRSAFEKLGIEAKEFVNLSPEEQLIALSEGYEKSSQNAETLNAVLKALGKSGADLIPVLKKGPEALREEMEEAAAASNETVATLDAAGDNLEKLWGRVKVAGAEAINFVIKRVEALGTGIAMIVAYASNLKDGFAAAAKAADDVLQAAAELQIAEQKKQEDAAKARKPVDTDALEAAKKKADDETKSAEELAKVIEENKKKEEDAYMRSLTLLQKKLDLERQLRELQSQVAPNELEAEKSRGKGLDVQKELESVNKDIAKEDEKAAKERQDKAKKEAQEKAKVELEAKKAALKDAEKSVSSLEKLQSQSVNVDTLRQIGGGTRGVNYNFGATKDGIQKQQLDYARQQVERLDRVVKALETQAQANAIPTYDGSFN